MSNISNTLTSVEPLFIKDSDLPTRNVLHIEIVRAIARNISPQNIDGVQRIGRLWRIYLKNHPSRIQLITKKQLVFNGKVVPLYDQNPFAANLSSPEDRKDKITIRGLPNSLSNDDIKDFLISKNLKLSADVKFSFMRDENGSLTSYKNGDRFTYCEPLEIPLPRSQKICNHNCTIIHHGKENMTCKSCNTAGHKAGDPGCKARATPDSILAFRGYQHPLSNHFPTPIAAFDLKEPFRSVEHAFYYKMALELNLPEMANRIQDAAHAGIVNQICKEINEEDRIVWENDNTQLMKELLLEKAKSSEAFRTSLLTNKDKILADCSYNKLWGSGISKWLTEATKPEFWPGRNILGALLMDISETVIMSSSPEDTVGDVMNAQKEEQNQNTSDEESLSEESESEEQGKDDDSTEIPLAKKNSNEQELQDQQIQRLSKSQRKRRNKAKHASNTNGAKHASDTQNQEMPNEIDKNMNEVTNSSNTRSKGQSMDIRAYLDPKTGKRKTLETTPEKHEHAKKSATRND
jgi:ribA/ribD-fused uncharacterized protein